MKVTSECRLDPSLPGSLRFDQRRHLQGGEYLWLGRANCQRCRDRHRAVAQSASARARSVCVTAAAVWNREPDGGCADVHRSDQHHQRSQYALRCRRRRVCRQHQSFVRLHGHRRWPECGKHRGRQGPHRQPRLRAVTRQRLPARCGQHVELRLPGELCRREFPTPPPISVSAGFFRLVGRIDNELFATDTSGYTQYGRAYLALQSDVPDAQFIKGYARAASIAGLEYTPLVNGLPALFQGGAAFPSNDWTANPGGEEYLARIPADSHRALGRIRAFHLRVTQEVLRKLDRRDDRSAQRWHESDAVSFDCR